MSSLLTVKLVLLALSAMQFQTVAKSRKNSPIWTNSRSPRKTKLPEVTCDHLASCAPGVNHVETCFCDRVCRIYGDCCPDYVDEEGDRPLTPLSPRLFTCRWMFPNPVYIITECPTTYDVHQFVLDGCRNGSTSVRHQSNEIFYIVPVSSRTSGLVYQNIYCAMCNGEENIGFWNVTTTRCGEVSEQVTSEPDSAAGIEEIGDLMQQESFIVGCLFSFTPVSDFPEPRRCVDSIGSCPVDADAELASRCVRPSNVAYVYKRMTEAYRNHDCAACHGITDYDLSCNSSQVDSRSVGGNIESFAVIFDLNTGKGSAVKAGSSGSLTKRLGSCPERQVYDPFARICRAITCPPGHSFTENGQCRLHSFVVDGHKRSRFRYRSDSVKTADDLDCAWIQFDPSEYELLSNRSIYVPLHDTTYDVNSYQLDTNQTAYVCTLFQRNYTEWVHEALRVDAVGAYLSLVCSIISLLALAFQFTVYMAFPVLRNTPGRCIVCLVVSLFVGQLLFLLVKTGSSVSPGFCFGQAAVMHFAFMAAFCWMNVMAVDVYRTFGASPGAAASSSSPSGARRRFAAYSAYAWASAALIVGVGVALDLADVGGTFRPHYGHGLCWFGSRGGLVVLFGVPVGVLLAANIIMFALSVRQIRNASKASQMAVQKTDQTKLLVSNNVGDC